MRRWVRVAFHAAMLFWTCEIAVNTLRQGLEILQLASQVAALTEEVRGLEGKSMNMAKTEVGRELKADELRIGRAYLLHKASWGHTWLMRCAAITKRGAVGFYSVTPGFTTVLTRRLDGTLADGAGAQVHVYEYLGDDDQPPEGQAA